MQVLVVSNRQGRILSVSRLGDVGEMVSGVGRAGVFPEANQKVHEVEVPEQFTERSLLDLHSTMQVRVVKGRPSLVPVERGRKNTKKNTKKK
jgi:hypothetical protein